MASMTGAIRRRGFMVALMGGLCCLAYGRALGLPLISDDYVQIWLAREYGPFEHWRNLAADALYRCRATSLVLTYWTDRLIDSPRLAFNLTSLFLHILNTLLVFLLGYWKPIGWRVSAVAACYFAVHQGHQEAVIWYAALPELLVFTFAIATILLWIRWLTETTATIAAYGAAFLCFVLALLSKESAVMVVPILIAIWHYERPQTRPLAVAPFAILAGAYFVLAYAAKSNHLHFNDGTFSLSAPFYVTIIRSTGRILWPLGFVAVGLLVAFRQWRFAWAGLGWMVIALAPYSFLTYQPHVPSRHTYLAAIGLALILAVATLELWDRYPARRRVLAAAAALVVLLNCGYIWTRKHRQFEIRAEPTERFVEAARRTQGPIHVECFPYPLHVAHWAAEISTGRKVDIISSKPGAGEERGLNLCVE